MATETPEKNPIPDGISEESSKKISHLQDVDDRPLRYWLGNLKSQIMLVVIISLICTLFSIEYYPDMGIIFSIIGIGVTICLAIFLFYLQGKQVKMLHALQIEQCKQDAAQSAQHTAYLRAIKEQTGTLHTLQIDQDQRHTQYDANHTQYLELINTQLISLAEISRKIETEMVMKENTKRALGLKSNKNGDYNFKFICPAWYDRKPIPYFASSDQFALQIMQNLIGHEKLDIIYLSDDKPHHSSPMHCDPDKIAGKLNELKGDCIFLCSPRKNQALGHLAPVTKTGGSLEFLGRKLPVWFALAPDHAGAKRGENEAGTPRAARERLVIVQHDKGNLTTRWSGADEAYDLAEDCLQYEDPKITTPSPDFGVIARLTVGSITATVENGIVRAVESDPHDLRKIFIFSGIHQHGTWIAAHLFHEIIIGKQKEHDSVFSGHDFMMLVNGQFDPVKLHVNRCEIMRIWLDKGAGFVDHWPNETPP
jgi:hypothetical protein